MFFSWMITTTLQAPTWEVEGLANISSVEVIIATEYLVPTLTYIFPLMY
jgi:hypothetical protein